MAKTLYSQSGKIEYGIKKYTVDTEADKEALNLRTTKMGSKCYVMDTKKWYILNSSNQWIPFVGEGGSGRSPFNIKGSVATVNDLPTEDNEIGDLYIVTADSSEYVWIEGDPTGHWEQLGLEAERFVVNVTSNNNQISADKTFAEITAAYNKGQILIAIYNEMDIYYLSSIVDDEIVFVQRGSASTDQISEHTLIVLYNNEWQFQTTTLKSTTATNVASAVYDMTSAQKTQTLSNLGGAQESLKLTATPTAGPSETALMGGTWSGATWEEVVAAIQASRLIQVDVTNIGKITLLYNLGSATNAASIAYVYEVGDTLYNVFAELFIANGQHWFRLSIINASTKTVNIGGTLPTITPAANRIYKCGELTSLTISNPPATGKYSIIFFSGSTPTTTVGIENFVAEANKRYKITVEDNYATYDSWPYTP